MEVLALLCGGASNDEIGVRLGVTEKTVESHLRRLFDRYGVLSRTELAVLALREGWVAEKGRRVTRAAVPPCDWRPRRRRRSWAGRSCCGC